MVQIILERCPRCLARLSKNMLVLWQIQLDRRQASCDECAGLTQEQVDALYARRLASARVWYKVPIVYEITQEVIA